jgi:hypothetical protein
VGDDVTQDIKKTMKINRLRRKRDKMAKNKMIENKSEWDGMRKIRINEKGTKNRIREEKHKGEGQEAELQEIR